MSLGVADYRAARQRIERGTLVLGAVAALAEFYLATGRAAAGVAVGTALAWMHFRWLQKGIAVLETASTRPSPAPVRVPTRVYARFFGGFALLLAVLCAIFFYSLLPAAAVFAGLFTLVAGVLCEGVYQLARTWGAAADRIP